MFPRKLMQRFRPRLNVLKPSIKSNVFKKVFSRRSRKFKLNEPRCLTRTQRRLSKGSREFSSAFFFFFFLFFFFFWFVIRTWCADHKHIADSQPLFLSHFHSHLNKQVESGTLKLIDEKKALAEITTLKRSLKQVSSTASVDESIAADRAKIEELRKILDDPENKKVQARWEELKTELDALRAEGNKAYEERSGLFDQRTALQKELVSWAIRGLRRPSYEKKRLGSGAGIFDDSLFAFS
jgi:hypothetical protein